MRSRLAVLFVVGIGLVAGLLFARQRYLSVNLPREQFDQKTLHILTYSSFVNATGPGTSVFNQFKFRHNCEIKVQTTSDAGLLIERARLAEGNSPFDVIIGLDQILLPDAIAKLSWREVKLDRSAWNTAVSGLSHGNIFVPFDWSPMTFVYRKGGVEPPRSFKELLEDRLQGKIGLQDPRASSPGMQFLRWVNDVEGTHAASFLSDLRPNVMNVAPSWSFSYGLFQEKQVEFVFSYLTSLAYHWGVDNDRTYQVVSFQEGHPVQIEYAGIPASCRECELAESFLRELLEPQAQTEIMNKNFMFPVRNGLTEGTIYAALPELKIISRPPSAGLDLSDWDKAFRR